MNKKVLAVASIGGHWIQLLRICKGLEDNYNVVYVSSNEKSHQLVPDREFYAIPEFSRWNIWKAVPALIKSFILIIKLWPNAVITTGAAPGLVLLFASFLLGRKTIWVDSIANIEELSKSGKIASRFASKVYTQWPDLANEKIIYAGNILGDK